MGSLCANDRVPRELRSSALAALVALERQVEVHLAVRVHGRALERTNAELRQLQRDKDMLVNWSQRRFTPFPVGPPTSR